MLSREKLEGDAFQRGRAVGRKHYTRVAAIAANRPSPIATIAARREC